MSEDIAEEIAWYKLFQGFSWVKIYGTKKEVPNKYLHNILTNLFLCFLFYFWAFFYTKIWKKIIGKERLWAFEYLHPLKIAIFFLKQ